MYLFIGLTSFAAIRQESLEARRRRSREKLRGQEAWRLKAVGCHGD
jgi:hypothetical protein